MRVPRGVSGQELIAALARVYGYRLVHREGSHVVLETDSPRRHRLSVPDHRALRVGTLNSILRAVAEAQGLGKQEVLQQMFG